MKRDHSCQAPYCVTTALPVPCPKCGFWLCAEHMPIHDCEKLDSWQTAAPALNALKRLDPAEVKVDRKKGSVKVHLPLDDFEEAVDEKLESSRKPSRKDWREIIPK